MGTLVINGLIEIMQVKVNSSIALLVCKHCEYAPANWFQYINLNILVFEYLFALLSTNVISFLVSYLYRLSEIFLKILLIYTCI